MDVFGSVQVEVGLKQLACHFVGTSSSDRALEAFAEASALQIKGRKPLPKKPSRKSRQQPDMAPLQQALFIIDGGTGALQVCSSPCQCRLYLCPCQFDQPFTGQSARCSTPDLLS